MLLQMSLSGGCVIVAALLLRALGRNRLPGWTFSALWSIAWLRLMLPAVLPSRLSAWTLVERWITGAKPAQIAAAMPNPAASPLPTNAAIEAPRALQSAQSASATLPASQGTLSIWTLLWLLGALLCVAAFAASYLRWRGLFRDSEIVDNAFVRGWLASHPLRRKLSVRQSAAVSAPLTYGVLRPVILLPEDTDWTDEETLNCAFAHEFVHIRRLDALRKPLLALAPCVHWFNPLAWAMWILANRDIELICDEAAIRRLGANSRRAYALALLKLEERRGDSAAFAAFGRSAIEERIGTIMKHRKLKLPALMLAILLLCGITAAFATTAPENAALEDAAVEGAAMEAPVANAADYSVYEPFGLVYTGDAGDAYRTNYSYNGQPVRFFNDPIAGASFTNRAGAVDVEAIYEDGRLTGLRECSPEDYARHTERFERAFGKAAAGAPDNAAQDMPAGAASAPDNAAQEMPAGAASVPDNAAQEMPAGAASAPDNAAQDIPAGTASAPGNAAQDMPAGAAGAPDNTAQEMPAGAASAPDNAAQEMPAGAAGKAVEEFGWLTEYEALGVNYDAESGKWLYNGAPIRALIDPEAEAVFRSDDGTIRLAALRDVAGEVYALEEITESEASQLMLAMNPQGASTAVEAASLSDAGEVYALDELTESEASQLMLAMNPQGASTAVEAASLSDTEMTETALTRLETNHPEMAAWARAQYPDAVWWTVEGYAARMEARQQALRGEEGRVIGWNSSGVTRVTPALMEDARAEDEEILSLLADGWLISKSIGGDENLYTRIDPAEWESMLNAEYELSVTLNDGTDAHFGPYDTTEELLAEFSPFALKQVASGNLDESEAQEILANYQGMI